MGFPARIAEDPVSGSLGPVFTAPVPNRTKELMGPTPAAPVETWPATDRIREVCPCCCCAHGGRKLPGGGP